MSQFYTDPSREADPHALPNAEVFYRTQTAINSDAESGQTCWFSRHTEGWYWWPCFPGCLPDGDPIGPFATEQDAIDDAQDY